MAKGLNKAMLIGRLGKDPDTRFTQAGAAVCNFSMATSEQWNDKASGEKKERTEWHKVVAFGKLAEICGKYLAKGSNVYVEGKLQTRSWEQNGVTKYMTEININDMQMLDSKKSGQSQSTASIPESQINGQGSTPQTGQYTPEGGTPLVVSSFDDSGDIPF